MESRIYFDHGSSAPLRAEARTAIESTLDTTGDPLGLHTDSRRVRRILEEARSEVAERLFAQPDEIAFTSGGTESVALGIRGAAIARRESGDRVVVSAVEHPSVLGAARSLAQEGFMSVSVGVDPDGRIDLERLASEIRKPGTVLASVQHANHEVGTMQAVAEAAQLCREAGVIFHTDACQTTGRLPIDATALGADLLSISAHKFGGPSGAGALYVRRGVALSGFPPGDDRERRRRAGMENVAGVAGMAAALSSAMHELPDQAAKQWSLTERLRLGIEAVDGATVHGHPTQRVPHLVGFSVPGLDPEVLLMSLDEKGFEVGGGSVASGMAHEASPVLEAMGVPHTVSTRIGVGPSSREEDVERFLELLPGLVAELRQMADSSAETLSRLREESEPA
ncbi:MAG: cysteine desulfurase family protein [Actinomycetota bacterium]